MFLAACTPFAARGGDATPPPRPSPTAEQQHALQDPEQTVRLYADSLVQGAYDQVQPLLSEALRLAFIKDGDGNFARHYTYTYRKTGQPERYTVLETRRPSEATAEVDLEVTQSVVRRYTVVLNKAAEGWQINDFREIY